MNINEEQLFEEMFMLTIFCIVMYHTGMGGGYYNMFKVAMKRDKLDVDLAFVLKFTMRIY